MVKQLSALSGTCNGESFGFVGRKIRSRAVRKTMERDGPKLLWDNIYVVACEKRSCHELLVEHPQGRTVEPGYAKARLTDGRVVNYVRGTVLSVGGEGGGGNSLINSTSRDDRERSIGPLLTAICSSNASGSCTRREHRFGERREPESFRIRPWERFSNLFFSLCGENATNWGETPYIWDAS